MGKKIWTGGVIGVVVLALSWIVYSKTSQPSSQKPGAFPSPEPPPLGESLDKAAVVSALVKEGWSRSAAEAVVTLNAQFYRVLSEEDSAAWENALARLQQLGQHPALMELFERHPEVAGLLAGAIDPMAVAAPLYDSRGYDVLSGIYFRHAADLDALAAALRDHKPVMIHLQEAGFSGAEVVFLYPRTGDAAHEYGRWLDDLLRRAVRRGEDDLISALGIVLTQGTAIRRRMEDDAVFRQQFSEDIWPRFERLVDRGYLTWEQAAYDNNLFDLLALPEGESLIQKWGLLPSYLLFGPDRYPEILHSRVILAMERGDNDTLSTLLKFGTLDSFQDLLRRDGLSDKTLPAALNRLQQTPGVNVPAKLEFFASLSDEALAEEVGPPPDGPVTWLPLCDTYQVTRKLIQGRPVSGLEWATAIADPALLFLGPAKAGTKGTQVLTTTLRNNARKQAAKHLGKEAIKVSGKELAPWLFSQVLRNVRQETGGLLKKKLTMEITGPVRYFYAASGTGRETFKRLTKLEARLFMRADAKVFVRFDRLLTHPMVEKFFKETAESALQQFAPGLRQADLVHTAWQQNASAWWFINAVGIAN